MMKTILNLFLLLVVAGCFNSAKSPEGVLEKYISGRFAGKSYQSLEEYLSPEFIEKLNSINEESEDKFEKLDYLKKKRFKIISSACESNDCKITYYVAYYTLNDNKKEFLTETKKIASLKKQGSDNWKIHEITHIKTFHDSLEDIEINKESL